MACRGGRVRVPAQRKVTVVPLCFERQFSTQGSTSYVYHTVGPQMLEGVGPFVEDIIIHGRTLNRTTNFVWKVIGRQSVDGNGWVDFTADLLPDQTADGQTMGAAYSNRIDFGMNLHFAVAVKNSSGTDDEFGNVTAYAAIKFWS